jgi:predicted amidohydrolase
MEKLRIVPVQSSIAWEDPEANFAHFGKIIEALASVDVIILPEMFTTGFSMNTTLAENMQGRVVEWMQKMAARSGAAVCGSVMAREGSQSFNRLFWVEPSGDVRQYDKRHLFTYAGEGNHFVAGTQKLIITWKGWRIMPVVCYDLRFPVWLRRSSRDPYDLLIVVANWPESRITHWDVLLAARAIENQVYVAGINRTGTDHKGLNYPGHSRVISPKGDLLHDAGERECHDMVSLDADLLTRWRSEFNVSADADHFTFTE